MTNIEILFFKVLSHAQLTNIGKKKKYFKTATDDLSTNFKSIPNEFLSLQELVSFPDKFSQDGLVS